MWVFLIIALLLLVIGVFVWYRTTLQKMSASWENENKRISEFRSKAIATIVDFDHCRFRNSSYLKETGVDSPTENIPGFLPYSDFPGWHTSIETKEIVKSVLYYLDAEANKTLVQEFPMEETILKLHVMQGHVTLYKDPFDSKKYFFEIAE